MDAPEDFDEESGRPLPNKFRHGLDALDVNYPGCENDLMVAREALEMGRRKDFLKAFRVLKGNKIAHEHYQETNESWNLISDQLTGNETEKREMQTWFHNNPPTEQNVKIFKERIEGLRNKDTVIRGDRSHPNITSLLRLQLSYPGCEEDFQAALEVHYSRPLTRFPSVLHSLQAKQDLHSGNRSHWRLVKLDDLELTYPRWKKDVEAVEDWHIHNSDTQENDILFHEIIEGMLEKEAMYLEWIHQRRIPKLYRIEAITQDDSYTDESRDPSKSDEKESSSILGNDAYESVRGRDTSTFNRYYTDAREEHSNERTKNGTRDA